MLGRIIYRKTIATLTLIISLNSSVIAVSLF